MATKIERAFNSAHSKASAYVEEHKRYLKHEYCMSEDQISRVCEAYRKGFMDGVTFK